MKAIKIALLYWLQQALRAFCPHSNFKDARHNHAPVCPACALWLRAENALSSLCGMQAIYRLRKCDLCFEPLSARETGVHARCADRENALAENRAA
jgi:predicted amidophosphoribosyltransferase